MENKKRSILNLFDIIIITVALILGAVLFFAGRGNSEEPAAAVNTHPMRYTIELTGMQNGSAELIKEGDALVDKIKKYNVGTVMSVEVSETKKQVNDLLNGGIILAEYTGEQTATVVVEAQVTETDTQITVDGGFVLRVGLPVNLKGPGYYGTGYIIGVERSDG